MLISLCETNLLFFPLQIGYCRTKLNTLINFPTQGLDMSPYLAPHSNQRPASATLQRRIQLSTSKAKTFASHSKSVRFEDTTMKSFSRTSTSNKKESKFHLPWKKRRGGDHRMKYGEAVFTPNVCDSPSSIRSAPSTMGHTIESGRGKRVYSPVQSLDGSEMRARSPADAANTDHVYDLYAVCNHMGTMTRGHYTAFCRNPADGHWYMFDDNHIQSLSEEQLVTAGAYLLFYVRQSLLNQLPPLSSTSSSSSSSGSSSHWAMHIPRFRLDPTNHSGPSDATQGPPSNINEGKARSRFGSSTSAVSAPFPASSRGFSPQSPTHDNGSDVFVSGQGDTHSAISLPPPSNTTPLHHHQRSAPTYQSPSNHPRLASNARHASLRVSKPRKSTPENSEYLNEQFMRRGTSFHDSRNHKVVHKSLTDSGRLLVMPAHPAYPSSGQGLAMPSRSIPNMTAADPDTKYPLPSRSIPDMPGHMSPPMSARPSFPHDQISHFMTPQPHRARTYSVGQHYGQSGTESCV